MQEESSQSGSEMNEKEELQKDERNLLLSNVTKMYLMDLRQWPIFDYLLKSNLISQYRIVMAYCWDRKAIIVTEDKNVFSFSIDCFKASNSSMLIKELCGKNIKTFTHSVYSILALTEEGEVYICQYKKRKLIKTVGFVMLFTRMDSLIEKKIHIVDIACGSNHYIILTNNGIVYAWGRNTCGQVGNDSTMLHYYEPQHVKHALENKNVVQIACGSAFNIVVTNEGKLYGWGDNENGQIPIDDNRHNSSSDSIDVSNFKSCYEYPREITTILDKIVKVACGDDHTLALTNKGKVYAWGKNDLGQVGVATEQRFSPTMVNMPETLVDIAAYHDTSAAIGNNGTIYVWGEFFGQSITTPFPTILSRIHDVFAQTSFYNVMHKPLIFSTDDYLTEELNILESLGATFDDPSTSDFTIQVEEHPIHVHKAILKIRSQYFRDKFQRDCTENDQSSSSSSVIYTVTDKYSYIVYKAFLKYLYTGIVDVPSENASELMKLADEYHETNLKRDCGQLIKRAITSSNVAFFYTKIIEYNVKELEDFCFQFALRHMKAVVLSEDYIKLDMNTKDKLIRRAAQEDVFKT